MGEAMMNKITVTNYKAHQKGSLAAFFSVILPSGFIVHECKLFQKEGRRWIGLPSRPFTGKDGTRAYAPILEFTNREACERFRETVLDAIDAISGEQKPAVLAPAAGQCRMQIPPDDSDIPF
jgi:DNA-binding cell septation regulator SpoVG